MLSFVCRQRHVLVKEDEEEEKKAVRSVRVDECHIMFIAPPTRTHGYIIKLSFSIRKE